MRRSDDGLPMSVANPSESTVGRHCLAGLRTSVRDTAAVWRDRFVDASRSRRRAAHSADVLLPAFAAVAAEVKGGGRSGQGGRRTLAPQAFPKTADHVQELLSQPGCGGVLDARRRPIRIGVGQHVGAFDFRSGPADATCHSVHIGGTALRAYVPVQGPTDGVLPQLDSVIKGLALLPNSLLRLIKCVRINPGGIPGDARFTASGVMPPPLASVDSRASTPPYELDIYPQAGPTGQSRMDAAMVHEGGHLLSLSRFGNDTTSVGWRAWSEITGRAPLAASLYAQESMWEDFAETMVWYDLVKGSALEQPCRALFPQRFAVIDWLLEDSKHTARAVMPLF